MTGFSERSSSAKNARVTRTTPKTLVSNTRRTSSAVTSATGTRRPTMPALLMSTSSAPLSAATCSAAAFTLRSLVTSSCTKRPPSSRAASRPRSGSRAASHTSWPSSSSRRAASRPRPLFAPVMRIVLISRCPSPPRRLGRAEFGRQADLGYSRQRARDRTGRLRLLGIALELLLLEIAHLPLGLQVDAGQRGRAVDVAQLHARLGLQRLGRVSRRAEGAREGHREAASVRRCDQLLWIRASSLAEARVV